MVDARAALAAGAPRVHGEAPGNVIVEGRVKTTGFDANDRGARTGGSRSTSARAGRTRCRWSRAPRMRPGTRPAGASRCNCATQMPHAMRTIIAELIGMPESDLRVIAPDVGGGFGQKMSLAPEFVRRDLARAQAQDVGRLDRGPARKSDRLLSQPRPVHLARRRLRRRRASWSRCRPIFSPMSAPIRAIRPPAASSR